MKKFKIGVPLIPTKKLIHWMPVDDPRLGSCMSGGQVSTGPLVPGRRINLEHPAYSTSPKSSSAPHQAPARQTGQTEEQEACSGWLVEAATALLPRQLQRFWPCSVPTSPTSPHSCGGSEFWREGWGSTNQLPWNTNGSVQLSFRPCCHQMLNAPSCTCILRGK